MNTSKDCLRSIHSLVLQLGRDTNRRPGVQSNNSIYFGGDGTMLAD